ncbi:Hypothetical protein RY67_1370 [Bifidobacterium longum subsp. infantis]|uniref:Uncharacterized protein n=1 Tax=Bifidobacterium longum subsp. infantis TaxID=1682 RepID=A0A0M5KV91_BIFLI|nr:Hypothetical protein RY67_1370 [Bifidobacterium longum subsp. infantis]
MSNGERIGNKGMGKTGPSTDRGGKGNEMNGPVLVSDRQGRVLRHRSFAWLTVRLWPGPG